MKPFDITSDISHLFEFTREAHPNYKGIILPHAAIYSLHGGFGDFVFQQIIRPLFDIWYSNYVTKQRTKAHSRAAVSLLELSFLMAHSVSVIYPGRLGKIHQKGGQINIFNSPAMDSKVQFEKSALYTTLDIHLKPAMLKRLYALYPDLMEPLMNAVSKGTEYSYYKTPIYATPEMEELAREILKLLRAPILDITRLDMAVIALFSLAIAQKLETTSKQFSHQRKRELEEQFRGLLQALTTDKIFKRQESYAKLVGMSVTALKENFHSMYGVNLKQYWRKVHMERAYHDVVYTDKSFEEIAFENGFADGASFSKAFKRMFAYAPSYYRNKKNEGGVDGLILP